MDQHRRTMPSKLSPPTFMPRRTLIPRNVAVMAFTALGFALTAGGLWAAPVMGQGNAVQLAGTVRIIGSRDAASPVSRWASILKRDHPDVHVITMLYGSATGAGALADGDADLVPLYRPLRPRERELIAATKAKPYAVQINPSLSDDARPMMLYFKPGGDVGKDRIAAEFVHIALSQEGRTATSRLP